MWLDSIAKDQNNFHDALRLLEKAYDPEKIVYKYMKRKEVVSVTAGELFADIHRKSKALAAMGLAGKRVGIIGKNSYDWIVCFYALTNLGCVAVLISADFTAEQLLDAAFRTELSGLLYDEELADRLEEVPSLSGCKQICMQDESGSEESYEALVHNLKPNELACIMFTSGTTSKHAKAVAVSARALVLAASMHFVEDPYESALVVLPLHHIAGVGFVMNGLFRNLEICLGENPGQLSRCLKYMKPEAMFAVPALANVLAGKLEKAEKASDVLGDKMRVIICGGAKFPVQILQTFLDKGIKMWQCYGSTELTGRGMVAPMTMENYEILGRPAKLVEADIRDGELLLRSPYAMMGYYRDEEETGLVLDSEGWIHTGDACRRDEAGNYYLTGRIKNLIILSNGENVSPEEIESALGAYACVSEILVREEEDRIGAWIYPDYSEVQTEEEKEAVRQKVYKAVDEYNDGVVSYKQVQRVTIVTEPLPKTSTNKILR